MIVQDMATREANADLTDDDFDVDIRINERTDDERTKADDSIASNTCHSCFTCTCVNNC